MVQVKRLQPADQDELHAFADAFDDPLDSRATEEFLTDPRHHIFVGYVGEHPAGFVTATEILHPDKPRSELFLNEIGVIEAHRRQGVARALLNALRELADELGCRGIFVLTEPDNEAANALYPAAGARLDNAREVMYWFEAGEGAR